MAAHVHGANPLLTDLLPLCDWQVKEKGNLPPGNWILPTYANTDCWKDYEPGNILGKGTFGTTYLALKKGTSQKVAVKVGNGPRSLFLPSSLSGHGHTKDQQ